MSENEMEDIQNSNMNIGNRNPGCVKWKSKIFELATLYVHIKNIIFLNWKCSIKYTFLKKLYISFSL